MHFPVHPVLPPFQPYCCYSGGFTPEECDKIVDLAELYEFRKGRVGNNATDLDTRDSDITWLHANEETHWIHERISAIVSKVNFDKFQLDLNLLDGVQYTKYSTEQHYDWHIDSNVGVPVRDHRKLSMTLMLSHPDDYEGGSLVLNTGGNPDRAESFKPPRGDIVFFYSFVPHKVMPVTKGERVSLVTWVLGPKLS